MIILIASVQFPATLILISYLKIKEYLENPDAFTAAAAPVAAAEAAPVAVAQAEEKKEEAEEESDEDLVSIIPSTSFLSD